MIPRFVLSYWGPKMKNKVSLNPMERKRVDAIKKDLEHANFKVEIIPYEPRKNIKVA